MNSMTTMGDRIRALRKKKNWSQEYLAGLVGCDQRTISALEKGRSRGTTNILKIARALDVSPYELIEGRKLPDQHPEIIAEDLALILRRAPDELKREGYEPTPELVATVAARVYNAGIRLLAGESWQDQTLRVEFRRALESLHKPE